MLRQLNIRQKLALQFTLLVSVLFLLFSLAVFLFARLYLNNRFFTRLQEKAIITGSLYIDISAKNQAIQELIKNSEQQALAQEVISIYDPTRKIFVFSTDILQEKFHRKFINARDTSFVVNNIETSNEKVSVLKLKNYWIISSAKDVLEQEALADLRSILIILCLVALLFITYLSWLMADRALSPLTTISKQLSLIFPKNLSLRILYPNTKDELGNLTQNINHLLDRAEDSLKTQRMFVTNISHELKNPLTKIFTQIEVLAMKYKTHTEFYNQILSLRSDTLMLNQLTQSLLELASIFSNEADLPKTQARVDEILIDSIAEFSRWNPSCEINFNTDNFPDDESKLIHQVNTDALKIVFKNLLDNACKFSINQKTTVELYNQDQQLVITFYNEGTPIALEDIKKITQPFFRSDSTAKGKKGHGVGLAIVTEILRLHHISLTIVPSAQGNTFMLSI